MAVITSLTLCWIWLSVSVLRRAASEDQKIRVGQNVTLKCQVPNKNPIIVVEWSRTDLGTEYVLLYRDGHFEPANQHPSFKNRVDLQDRQMKDGDVSLILKDVTADDEGTYECRVKVPNARRKRANLGGDPISIITLSVSPPGPTEEQKQDGGNKGDADEDRGNRKHYPLVVLLTVTVVMGLIIGVLYFKKSTKKNPQLSPSSDENQRNGCFQKKSFSVFL